MSKINLYDQGLENYPLSTIIFENFIILSLVFLGTILSWFFNPIIAWIYLTISLAMIYIILRKLICTNCYYYDKRCHTGWGKISSKLFKKGDIEKFSTSSCSKVPPVFFALLTIIPIILSGISLFVNFSIVLLIFLVLFILISIYNGVVNRKNACSKCKMKLICPGSADK